MKIKIGIVGFKDVAKAHYSELRRSNKFEVCGIFDDCNSNECSYSRVEIYTDFKKFISQSMLDAVVICVDKSNLLDIYFECLKYTKNILIASPICKDISDIRQMRYGAVSNKANVSLCFSDRFNPVITSLKKALLKDSEIYSIDIFHSQPIDDTDIVSSISIFDIDLVRSILNNTILSCSYSFLNKADKNIIDNININFKSKNQVLVSIINSISLPLHQFNIRVCTKSGVYFADLLGLKLYQLNPNGQINLKVNNEDSKLKILYDEFYSFCQNSKSDELVLLDDVINIKELFK